MLIERRKVVMIKEIIDQKLNKVFDIGTQYKFLQLYDYIENEIKIMKAQIRLIIDRYGERDENGELVVSGEEVKIQPALMTQCQEDINNLYDYQVQMPDILFTIDELKDLELTLKDLIALKPFIKE